MKTPSWQPSTTPRVIQVNTAVEICCRSNSNIAKVEYQIYHNDKLLTSQPQCAIKTTHLQKSHSGVYTCVTHFKHLRRVSKTISVKVAYLDAPSISPGSDASIPEGDGLYRKCVYNGFPTPDVRWEAKNKDGRSWRAGSKNQLHITYISRSQMASYRCCANNSMGIRCSEYVSVEVTYVNKPVVMSDSVKELKEYDSLHLNCSSSGFPQIRFSWLRNGVVVSKNSAILSIPRVLKQDAGIYTCQVENSKRQVKTSKEVEVRVQVARTPPDTESRKIVRVSMTATIFCSAATETSDKITWRKDGRLLPGNDVPRKILTIIDTQIQNSGNYSCVAEAVNGEKRESYVVLEVYYLLAPTYVLQSDKTLIEGKELQLRCSADGNPTPFYRWVMNENMIVGHSQQLLLANVSREVAGNYSCLVFNAAGVKISQTYSTDVLYIDKPLIDGHPKKEIKKGDSLTLSCTTKANPSVKFSWWKATDAFDATKRTLLKGEDKSTISIADAKADNIGYYICSVENTVRKLSSDAMYLDVQYTGDVSITPSTTQTIKKGDALTITCASQSNPKVKWDWYYNGHHYSSGSPTLKIDSIKKSDAGFYHCVASNSVETKKSTQVRIFVSYIEKPKITPKYMGYISEGTEVTLTCENGGYPQVNIEWRKDGQILTAQKTPKLSLGKLGLDQGGVYSCSVQNSEGKVPSDDLRIRVAYVRTPTLTSTSSKVKEKDTALLSCNGKFEPQVQYSWYRGGQLLKGRSGKTLVITTMSRDEEGQFQCKITSTVDSKLTEPSGKLEILTQYVDTPTINALTDTTVSRGSSVRLSCQSKARPPMKVTWFHGSTKLDDVSPILTLSNVQPSVTGDYICKTRNDLGEKTSAKVKVNVQYLDTPVVISSSEGIVTVGTELIHTCVAEGNPLAVIRWKKGTSIITSNKLVFKQIKLTDAGNYICEASNRVKTTTSNTVNVRVQAVSPCAVNPCQNGVCRESNGVARCICRGDYSGPTCAQAPMKVKLTLTVDALCPTSSNCIAENQIEETNKDVDTMRLILNVFLENLKNYDLRPIEVTLRLGSILLDFTFIGNFSGSSADSKKQVERALADRNYTVSTSDGFRALIKPNSVALTDYDECAAGTHTCSANANCENQLYTYKCTCKSGYTGDGFVCKAVNKTWSDALIGLVAVAAFLIICIIIIICCLYNDRDAHLKRTFGSDYQRRSSGHQ